MSAIEEAEAVLAAFDDPVSDWHPNEADLAWTIRDLLAEHKRVLAERPTVDEKTLTDYLAGLVVQWGSPDAACALLLVPEEARIVAEFLLSRFTITEKEQS